MKLAGEEIASLNVPLRQDFPSWLWLLHHCTGCVMVTLVSLVCILPLCDSDDWMKFPIEKTHMCKSDAIRADTVSYGSFIFITLLIIVTRFNFSD